MSSFSRVVVLACALGPLVAAAGKPEDEARITFQMDLNVLDARGNTCPDEQVRIEKVGTQWYVKGCARSAFCDTVRNKWTCKEIPMGHVVAVNKVMMQSGCDGRQIRAVNRQDLSLTEVVYRVEACGSPWQCVVKVANDEQTSECRQLGVPAPAAGAAPGPGNVTPATGPVNNCLPPCRAGFACVGTQCLPVCNPACPANQVCIENRCVSLCNPPCPQGLVCTPEATCVPPAK